MMERNNSDPMIINQATLGHDLLPNHNLKRENSAPNRKKLSPVPPASRSRTPNNHQKNSLSSVKPRKYTIKFVPVARYSPDSRHTDISLLEEEVIEEEEKPNQSQDMSKSPPTIVQLNVGGTNYATTLSTLMREKDSLLASYFGESKSADAKTSQFIIPHAGGHFIDRDGQIFRFVLDYLRTGKLVLPESFNELNRLREEAKFWQLTGLSKQLKAPDQKANNRAINANGVASALDAGGYISIGYRGTFAFGRDGQADVKFRKLNRILVCGKAILCREVFAETLNESRDPDREGVERYSARLYLKHQSLERAFDCLAEKGFKLAVGSASGANGVVFGSHTLPLLPTSGSSSNPTDSGNVRSSADWEEQRWSRYAEFVFYREPRQS